ncbi:hypothetical protein GF323_05255 [Candidatus Woesearchaeota archaeon]|nr:hypothetical protein [Candidatus Woesearchaeota archaeon]
MIKKYLIGIVVVATVFLAFQYIDSSITGLSVKEERVVIYFPRSADFPNTEKAGVVFELNFPAASFKVNNKTADLLLWLDSEVIPGLKVAYDVNERKIKAGLPLISSEEVDLIDGKPHKVIYNFNRQEKNQRIYLDGKLVAEGKFTGKKEGELLSGYAVYDDWRYVESKADIKITGLR